MTALDSSDSNTSSTLVKTEALYIDLFSRLNSVSNSLQDRFRALFTLKSLYDERAIDIICECFTDSSVLLKHELAYCLGQMKLSYAIPKLIKVLEDEAEDVMVRHEAGEALGAIGDKICLPILQKFTEYPNSVIAETCQLSLERINRLHNPQSIDYQALQDSPRRDLPFVSVDPAVADESIKDISLLERQLCNTSGEYSLYERYRAMFTLRNMNNEASVLALCKGFKDTQSALFRHEIAYVLGQLQHPASVPALGCQLAIPEEHPMVRHECAEALGAIANEEANDILSRFVGDKERVVHESVLVALDILAYEQSTSQFQYATLLQDSNEPALSN